MIKDLMIQASFWSSLMYSASYPVIHLYLMKFLNEKQISLNSMISCVFTIVINSLWVKYSKKLYKSFPILLIIEIVVYTILHLLMIFEIAPPVVYYFTDLMLFGLITRNIMCGSNRLRSIIYTGEKREKYDNLVTIVCSAGCMIGSMFIMVSDVNITIAWIISLCGISIDNILFLILYYSNRKSFDDTENNCE